MHLSSCATKEDALPRRNRPDVGDTKAVWRKWANQLDRSGASAAVVRQLLAWPPLQGVVAGYLPMRSEISVVPVLDHERVTPVIPRVEGSGIMTMRAYESDGLVHHRLGFEEPSPESPITEPESIDVVLLPGLVFDTAGGRLGRGKGYYDRFIASLPRSTARVGVTTDDSVVEAVPMEDHDERLGWLATESGVRWVGGAVAPETARFMEHAVAAGIAPNIEHFPEGTRTSRDAARAVGCELGAISKSLVFVVDDTPVLVLCSGDRRVDEDALAAHFSASSARPASRDRVLELTGYQAGGTPALGHETPLEVVADPSLRRYRRVWTAGGTPDTVYEVTLDRLIAASGARWVDIAN